MTDTGLPTYLNRGVFLSKDQLRTELGAELLSLCQSVTADGRIFTLVHFEDGSWPATGNPLDPVRDASRHLLLYVSRDL